MLMHQSRLAPSRVFGVALAIAAASLFADIASAAKDDGQVSTVVKYARSRSFAIGGHSAPVRAAEGRFPASLRQRIHARLADARLYKACYVRALNRAVERVNEPKLTALHAAEPRIGWRASRAEVRPYRPAFGNCIAVIQIAQITRSSDATPRPSTAPNASSRPGKPSRARPG